MKEALAVALHSSNLKQKEAHCALDKIHGLGLAAMHHPIGTAALRFMDAMQPKAHQELIFNLARTSGQTIKCDKKFLLRVCKQVVHEAAFKFCLTCLGRKEVLVNKSVIHCGPCGGIGLQRYSDMERAKAIGISLEFYLQHWSNILAKVQSIYSDECRSAIKKARAKFIDI